MKRELARQRSPCRSLIVKRFKSVRHRWRSVWRPSRRKLGRILASNVLTPRPETNSRLQSLPVSRAGIHDAPPTLTRPTFAHVGLFLDKAPVRGYGTDSHFGISL